MCLTQSYGNSVTIILSTVLISPTSSTKEDFHGRQSDTHQKWNKIFPLNHIKHILRKIFYNQFKVKDKTKSLTARSLNLTRQIIYHRNMTVLFSQKAQLKPHLTERSSLPVIARGLVGCTARAHSSPSQWPCMMRKGLLRSWTTTSKISLSCVPTRMWSPRQHTLRTDSPSRTHAYTWHIDFLSDEATLACHQTDICQHI